MSRHHESYNVAVGVQTSERFLSLLLSFVGDQKKKKLLKAQDWAVCPLWRAGLVENNSLFQISSKANNARSSPWSEAAELSRLPRLRVMCEWSKKP